MQPDYAYSSIDGESSDPKAVYEAVINEVEETRKTVFQKKILRELKRSFGANISVHRMM